MPINFYDDSFSVLRPLSKSIKRGKFSIPFIPKPNISLKKMNNGLFLKGFQNISTHDTFCQNKIIHFYVFDHILEKIYQHPKRYISQLAKYFAVMSPDYSMFPEMDEYGIISATYKNRYLGALWTTYGIEVIPTIGWTISSFYDICFEGVERDSIVSISTLGVHKGFSREIFLKGYNELKKRINPSEIICLGDPVDGMEKDRTIFVPYTESFGNQFKKGWQEKLFTEDSKGDFYYGF